MYLEHFKLAKAPFTLTPNTDFYCELPSHKKALNVLLLSLSEGEGFIKIVGEVGTGKTLLCRVLLKRLNENYVTAYIPNPDQNADGLRAALAFELGLSPDPHWTQHQLLDAINTRLLDLHRAGKKTVLLIDEAQALPESCLEAIRLLTNLETEERKLLQVVLFGQPELDQRLQQASLRQLQQRITFSYFLEPLKNNDLKTYVSYRLNAAGYGLERGFEQLFTGSAQRRLCTASRGLPRLLNILCHKSLLVAFGQGKHRVDLTAVRRAIADTESSAQMQWAHTLAGSFALGLLLFSSVFIILKNYGWVL